MRYTQNNKYCIFFLVVKPIRRKKTYFTQEKIDKQNLKSMNHLKVQGTLVVGPRVVSTVLLRKRRKLPYPYPQFRQRNACLCSLVRTDSIIISNRFTICTVETVGNYENTAISELLGHSHLATEQLIHLRVLSKLRQRKCRLAPVRYPNLNGKV